MILGAVVAALVDFAAALVDQFSSEPVVFGIAAWFVAHALGGFVARGWGGLLSVPATLLLREALDAVVVAILLVGAASSEGSVGMASMVPAPAGVELAGLLAASLSPSCSRSWEGSWGSGCDPGRCSRRLSYKYRL